MGRPILCTCLLFTIVFNKNDTIQFIYVVQFNGVATSHHYTTHIQGTRIYICSVSANTAGNQQFLKKRMSWTFFDLLRLLVNHTVYLLRLVSLVIQKHYSGDMSGIDREHLLFLSRYNFILHLTYMVGQLIIKEIAT